jgi:hypothetical protein
MSLEAKIDALTSAVLALTYALNQTRSNVDGQEDYSSMKFNKDGTVKAEKVPNEKSKSTTDTLPPSEPEFAEQLEQDPVTYDDVKKLIIAISKESKDKAVAALQRFGVANGKQLTESTYPEVVAYLSKVLAGEVNPGESHGA